MVLTLILCILHNHIQLLSTKCYNTIFLLPLKTVVKRKFVIGKMRTVPFHLTYKFSQSEFWRYGGNQMNMVINAANRIDYCS